MLKTTRLLYLALKAFRTYNNEIISIGNSRANKMVLNLFKNNKFRNLTYMPNIEAT